LSLSEATAWRAGPEGGVIEASWTQGRAAFGGLQATGALRAMAAEVAPDRALRSAMVDFVGPAAPGPMEVAVTVLRAGRSLTRVEARLSQAGQLCAVVLGAYGTTRPTRLAEPGPVAPEMAGPEGVPEMPYVAGLTPNFTQHFAFRWTGGEVPYSGGSGHVQGWVRPRNEAGAMHAEMLPALLDAWPPPVLCRSDRPIRGSSVSWMVNVVGTLPEAGVPGDAWWRYEARTVADADGYSDFTARLWDAEGHLVATSRQLFAEFSGAR
jgi:acyl-CoA thioesterase